MPTSHSAFLGRAVRANLDGYGGLSVLGVFGGITVSRLPVRLKNCIPVLQVADWLPADEFTVEVAFGADVVFAAEPRRFAALGLPSPAWVQTPLHGAVLPREGKYSVTLMSGAVLLAVCPLLVVRVPPEVA